MRKHYIDIDDAWALIFCYDYDYRDMDDMAALMAALGASDRQINEAMIVLFGVNTGMTISRADLRMSLVFVGEASSMEQFLDTTAHELYHVENAIGDYYDVPYDSEDAAWTDGYLMREVSRALRRDKVLC